MLHCQSTLTLLVMFRTIAEAFSPGYLLPYLSSSHISLPATKLPGLFRVKAQGRSC